MPISEAESIYIHLPFCKTKCPYCDFASFSDTKSRELEKEYMNVLKQEIIFRSKNIHALKKIRTVFFGGGTPNIHKPKDIEEIINLLKNEFEFEKQVEISLEANPGISKNPEKNLEEFIEAGINRISFGAQTFNPILLEKLARAHDINDSLSMIESLRSLSIKKKLRWSFDLIYGLPKETLESWNETIKTALGFFPKHLSAYALSIENETPYGKFYKNSNHPDLPLEDDLVDFYETLNEKLEEQGLKRYEISNWAIKGEECRHNINYWKAREYYAFGLSAHGYLDKIRYFNTKNLKEYLDTKGKIELQGETISKSEKYREKILLGLRLSEGLELDKNLIKFIDEKKLNEYIKAGYILEKKNIISLSLKGCLVSNTIICGIIK